MGDEVRFLCGLMIGVPQEQVEDIGRSCGATSVCPLHQKWKTDFAVPRGQAIVAHTAYIIPFGIVCAKMMKFRQLVELIPMLGWLLGFERELATGHLPCFTLSPRSQSDLGTYKQKNVDLRYWVEGIHQLILSVSLSRAGSQPRVTAQADVSGRSSGSGGFRSGGVEL